MKLKICIITILFILLSAIFSKSIHAQTPKQRLPTRELTEEQSVKKFADSFLKSFLKTMDLEKMPKRFFEKSFRFNFSKSNFRFPDKSKDENQSPLRYKQNLSQLHFQNLLAAIVANRFSPSNKSENESDSENLYRNNLPTPILKLLLKSKTLRVMLGEKNENETEVDFEKLSDEERKEYTKLIDKEQTVIIQAMRKHLSKFPIRYSKQFEATRANFFKYFEAELCKPEKCLGLPENTPIFSVHELMMCLRIARIDGELKIVQIYSVAMED